MVDPKVVVTGAGGFIGGHLVARLLHEGRSVRAVDWRPIDEWHQVFPEAENRRADLSLIDEARASVAGVSTVFALAANMGGMGFIETHKADCMLSVLTSTHTLVAARDEGVERYFYASSACVYAAGRQSHPGVEALKEADAYPAEPEDGYGWEKLFTERMCRHFNEDFGFATRVGRYHNIYGPKGTWNGGREKAPAAVCRKVAEAVRSGEHVIDIWGDGQQTRSFTYIDDCIDGTLLVTGASNPAPVNIGSSEMVTINQLVDIVEEIAGVKVDRRYDLSAPQGVRGRSSDNTEILARHGWEPTITLREGLTKTYEWIAAQVDELAQ